QEDVLAQRTDVVHQFDDAGRLAARGHERDEDGVGASGTCELWSRDPRGLLAAHGHAHGLVRAGGHADQAPVVGERDGAVRVVDAYGDRVWVALDDGREVLPGSHRVHRAFTHDDTVGG